MQQKRSARAHIVWETMVLRQHSDTSRSSLKKQKPRDNSRTPMQWNTEKNAGFTDGEPWIAVNDNYKTINAEAAVKDPESVFFYL